MTETEDWLTRYGKAHAEVASPLVFWIALPLLVLGVVGVLWTLPVPDEFYDISPLINWGSLFLMAATVYYFIISVPLAIGMLPFVLGIAAAQVWLENSPHDPVRVSTALVVAGLIGLLLGRRHSPQPAGIIQDLQLLMIGPAWLLSVLYRRIGIPI